MFSQKFKEIEGRLAIIIYHLATREGDIKTRLKEVFVEYNIAVAEFPQELQSEWQTIMHFLNSKPATRYENSVTLSLLKRRNKTCSELAKKVYAIYDRLKKINKDE